MSYCIFSAHHWRCPHFPSPCRSLFPASLPRMAPSCTVWAHCREIQPSSGCTVAAPSRSWLAWSRGGRRGQRGCWQTRSLSPNRPGPPLPVWYPPAATWNYTCLPNFLEPVLNLQLKNRLNLVQRHLTQCSVTKPFQLHIRELVALLNSHSTRSIVIPTEK